MYWEKNHLVAVGCQLPPAKAGGLKEPT